MHRLIRRLPIRSFDSDQLADTFLVSAITSILAVRLYLHLTNYPQIGGGSLHIAHMLWGGLLMMIAILLALLYVGKRIRFAIALIGGVGFGVFIDELGKFITRDHNYFFQPTIGLLYALFVILYLTISFLTRHRTYSSHEYQLNALLALEESIHHDLDTKERDQIKALLAQADQNHPLTKSLVRVVATLPAITPAQQRWSPRISQRLTSLYQAFIGGRHARTIIRGGLILLSIAIIVFIEAISDSSYDPTIADSGFLTANFWLNGQIISVAIAELCMVIGIILVFRNRLKAFTWLYRALLINLLLTQFFLFARVQFAAIPFFTLNLILLLLTRFVIHQESVIARTPIEPR